MKLRVLAGALALAMVPLSGFAADLPTKASKAPPLQPVQWTGFYVGGQVGALWSHETRDTSAPIVEVFSQDGSGWLGGGQIGYDYQWAPYALVGVEGSLSGVKLYEDRRAFSFLQIAILLTSIGWRPQRRG
jgi:outer membrane immunogenic protein